MMDKVSNWDIRDIPAGLTNYRVVTEPNTVTGEIKVTTEIMGRIQEEIIQTKSDQTRNALIDLGWTPPAGKESRPESKLPKGFREANLPKAPDCYFYGIQITELCVSDLVAAMAFMVEDVTRERE